MSEHARDETVISVGFFDGVHLGHRRLIEEARAEADRRAMPCVAVTFDRHPASIIRPEFAPALLTAVDHKLELLEATGVDAVHVVHFDHERARETAEEFVELTLVGELHAAAVVVGANFRFGYERQGDFAFLAESGVRLGFVARAIELVTDSAQHEVVTSSRIRALIAAGRLDEGAAMLGRPHEVRGFVTSAPRDNEAELGVLVDPELLLPGAGSYRVRLRIGETEVESRANVSGGHIALAEAISPDLDRAAHPGARVSCAFLERC